MRGTKPVIHIKSMSTHAPFVSPNRLYSQDRGRETTGETGTPRRTSCLCLGEMQTNSEAIDGCSFLCLNYDKTFQNNYYKAFSSVTLKFNLGNYSLTGEFIHTAT